MNNANEPLIRQYLRWLESASNERLLDSGWIELTVPFLDRHNDHLRVYAQENSGRLRMTDGGEIVRDLKEAGCDLLVSGRRNELLQQITSGLGTDFEVPAGELCATSTNGDFGSKLHHLLLSMLAVDGLANLSKESVANLFEQDVADWLTGLGVQFEEDVSYVGASKVEHRFEFKIRGRSGGRDKIIQPIKKPDKIHIQSFTYEVNDTRNAAKSPPVDFFAFLPGSNAGGKGSRLTLLANDITPIVWDHRDQHAPKFAERN